MIKVDRLARVLDRRPVPNFLAECIRLKRCPKDVTNVQQLKRT